MSKINWMEQLGWTDEQIEDLRYTGFSYVRQGKYDIALSFFEALTTLDPKNVYDIQTLGAIYLQLNQQDNAIKSLKTALALEPPTPAPILLNLAKTYFSIGKKEEGIQIIRNLKNDTNPAISNMAKALLLAYGEN